MHLHDAGSKLRGKSGDLRNVAWPRRDHNVVCLEPVRTGRNHVPPCLFADRIDPDSVTHRELKALRVGEEEISHLVFGRK